MVFSSLNEAGFDIYLMLRPLERKLNVSSLEPTEFYKMKYNLPARRETEGSRCSIGIVGYYCGSNNVVVVVDTAGGESAYHSAAKADLSNYVFRPSHARHNECSSADFANGDYGQSGRRQQLYPTWYKLNFSPDLVYGAAQVSTFYGLEGSTVLAFSDMLGDHQIIFQTDLLIDLKNSDYGITYYYLPGQMDWGFQAFHDAKFLYLSAAGSSYDTLYRFSTWAVGAIASYPIDRFNRIDCYLMWLNLSRDNLDDASSPSQQRSFLLPLVSYVNDNSIWQGDSFGPNNARDSTQHITAHQNWEPWLGFADLHHRLSKLS